MQRRRPSLSGKALVAAGTRASGPGTRHWRRCCSSSRARQYGPAGALRPPAVFPGLGKALEGLAGRRWQIGNAFGAGDDSLGIVGTGEVLLSPPSKKTHTPEPIPKRADFSIAAHHLLDSAIRLTF